MRQIKFRGLRKEYNKDHHDSEFMYGNLLNECSIGEVGIGLDSYKYAEVYPETVEQFTGLKDSKRTKEYPNGQDIYEGDKIKDINGDIYEVFWDDKYAQFVWSKNHIEDFSDESIKGEVIGNIHKNKRHEH